MSATIARVARLPHVASVVSPYSSGQHAVSPDGTIGFATVNFDQSANALPQAAVDRVITTAESARSAQLQVELGGQAVRAGAAGFARIRDRRRHRGRDLDPAPPASGPLPRSGLPIATALVGLGAGLGLITLASHVVNMADFAAELALMIGLGVGIDYALFIVTRYRENFHRQNGGDVPGAGCRSGDEHFGSRGPVLRARPS